MNYRTEVAAVKRLTKRIEQSEAEAEAAKWERAERLAGLCETATQRQVAEDTGLSKTTVLRAVRVWEQFGPVRDRTRYADADYEVAGRGPAQRPEAPAKITDVPRCSSSQEFAARTRPRYCLRVFTDHPFSS